MPRSIIIITHPKYAIGYQLAGVAVLEATNGAEAFNHLKNVIKDEEIGLIGVDEDLYESVNPRFLAAIKKRGKPLILSMQSVKDGSISVDDYIRKLTLSTAGVIVKVEKEN